MRPLVGSVPGWSYELATPSEAWCSVCERRDLPLLRAGDARVCEPCAILVAWVWRGVEGTGVPEVAYSAEVKFALVVIARERVNDTLHPFDVLMVERKDEPGAFGLPGGKVEPGETPAEAAARELEEETTIRTWPSALQPLYTGYSPRARLGTVFLCRGYDGDYAGPGPEGTEIAWKAWPPDDHARHLRGYYVGVSAAFIARWRTQRLAATRAPLSLQLGEPAVAYLQRRFEQADGIKKPDTERMLESFANVMSVEEKETIQIILSDAKRTRNEVAVIEAAVEEKRVEASGDEASESSKADDGQYVEADDGQETQTSFARSDYEAPKKTSP